MGATCTARTLVRIAAAAVFGVASPVFAQSYPAKPVRLLLGFPAGGPTDVIARVLAQRLSSYWGQPVVVENRPGADATIAMEVLAKSPPDGYTLYIIQPGVAINPALYKSVPFDPIKDFTPITLIGDVPNLIAIHPAVPANSLQEFLAYARQKKGQLFYGATSSPTMLATEMLNTMAGIQIVRVNFKGAAPAITALVSGETQVLLSGVGTLLPLTKAGKIRGIAMTSAKRSMLAPEIPTVDEAGVPGYVATTWYGVSAPGSTPRGIVDRVNADVRKALTESDVKARLLDQGIEPTPNSPDQFAEMIRSEIAKWEKVVRDSGVKIE
jgi:tripartite-type tricarboxylate transporter receptor subunit TctC